MSKGSLQPCPPAGDGGICCPPQIITSSPGQTYQGLSFNTPPALIPVEFPVCGVDPNVLVELLQHPIFGVTPPLATISSFTLFPGAPGVSDRLQVVFDLPLGFLGDGLSVLRLTNPCGCCGIMGIEYIAL